MYNYNIKRNLSMLMDFYEMTMSNGYFHSSLKNKVCVFDMFYRKNPDNGGYAIFAGLEQLIDNIKNFKFCDDDINYLKEQNKFSDEFLEYLRNFKFSCDIYSVKEGSPIFPNEPILIVKGPVIEAQLIETMALLSINHQTLIATKANRIVNSARGKKVFEFGSRRAQGYDASVLGARASYIGGISATSCVLSGQLFNIPVFGTMAHSWVQMFDSEYLAFKKYAELYPDNCILLIDTYNTLKSGIKNAIKVFDDVIKPLGKRPVAVRIDSGDLAYLSKKVRYELDLAGYEDVGISVSNGLDEYLIRDILLQDAKIDSFGVGENLITSRSTPVLGGVYKLVAVIDEHNNVIPKIKISETIEKISTPGFKKVYRIKSKETNMSLADYICDISEDVENINNITVFDPIATWKKKTFNNVYLEPLLHKIFDNGVLIYDCPTVKEIKEYCEKELETIWDESKRLEFPHKYYVDLSQKVYDTKKQLLENKI